MRDINHPGNEGQDGPTAVHAGMIAHSPREVAADGAKFPPSRGRRLRRLLRGALLGLAATAGCSGLKVELSEVTGLVLWNGRPARAEVVFTPAGVSGGRPSMAYTDSQGRFRLQFTDDAHGAIVGPHLVTVSVYTPAEELPDEAANIPQFQPIKVARFHRKVRNDARNEFTFLLTD